MAPEPQIAASEADAPRRADVASPRRWPLLGMIAFAVAASGLLWAGIFALIALVGSMLS